MAAYTTAILGLGLSAYQIYQGEKQRKEAQREIDGYERQDLVNAAENIEIAQIGANLKREEDARTISTLVDISRAGGIRGVLGGLPRIQEYSNIENRKTQASLEEQEIARQYKIAGEEERLRNIREARDIANIGALSTQLDAGQKTFERGLFGMAQAGATFSRDYSRRKQTEPTIERNPVMEVNQNLQSQPLITDDPNYDMNGLSQIPNYNVERTPFYKDFSTNELAYRNRKLF